MVAASNPTFDFEGPRSIVRTTRIRDAAAALLDSAAEDSGTTRSAVDAYALEFVAAIFLRHHLAGEGVVPFLNRIMGEL